MSGTCEAKESWWKNLWGGRKKIWDAVVFSNESKFNLFGSDRKRCCHKRKRYHYKERIVKKMVKHGGRSLMVWGCITRWGTGQLMRVVENMDRFQYVKILKQGLLGTLCDYNIDLHGIYFQQDQFKAHIPTCNEVF